MKLKIRLLAVLWPIVYLTTCSVAQAQVSAGGAAEPVALGIGDTIPEALWQLPLRVVNHPEGKDTITLGDYRGKLILLDFWGIGCGSCILALPKLDAVQRKFTDRVVLLPTARQAPETLAAFWKKNSYTKSIALPTLSEQQFLHRYFPHHTISHVVWISPDGRLYSTTHTEAVNEKYVNHALSGRPPHWQPKVDRALSPDGQQGPLATVSVGESSASLAALGPYYAVMTGFMPDRPQQRRQITDSAERTKLYTHTNVPLYRMILSSLGVSQANIPPSHVVWRVHDRSRYSRSSADGDVVGWRQANYYGYEAKVPMQATDAELRRALGQDLMRFFPGLRFRLDTLTRACLELVANTDLAAIASKGVEPSVAVGNARAVKMLHNQRIGRLVHLLNDHFDGMPVIDQTGYTGAVDIALPVADLGDIAAVREALREQGLDLREGSRRLLTLTIIDQPYTFTTN